MSVIQNRDRTSSQTLIVPEPGAVGGREAFVDSLVEAQASRTPDAIALVCGDRRLTYRELDRRATQVADVLSALGVGPDALVAICVERSLDMVVGLLGILKAGGAYLPLDPNLPAERLAFMLADARPAVLLTQRSLRNNLPEHAAKVIFLDALPGESPEGANPAPSPAGRTASDLAYVIYTSGSTGQPKGVQIPHRAVVNFLRSMQTTPGLCADDVLLAVTTLSFDIAGLELFLPLITGATVVIATRDVAMDGARLAALMAESGTTVMQATPATWRMLLDANWNGSPRLKILCGGEAWSADLARELLARCGSLWNMYGPTETTIWSSVCKVDPARPVVIGPPIANTTFHLLGEDSQPVRAGETGELCIGGDGLARGYLNRPELTAQRFVPDPFSREPGARLYKTGDLARQIPDGNFEFLGRRDHQVKIRGFRIELGEIETVLRGHPAVRDAVVVAHEAAPGDTRLVAYVTAANSHRPAHAEMRRFLEAKLPRYMVPVAFTELPSFPLTPNGKLDRKALPVPDPGHMESAENHVAPRNTAEEKLAAIWSDVLGVSGIGVNDDFFELGGHSLLATRVVSRVRDVFNVEASVRDLFEAPTIGGFARRVIDARAAESGGAPPILPVPRDGSLPASFAQERLWFLDQMEASRAVYNMPAEIRIAGALQPAVLRRCMAEVLRRHESLRTNFEAIDGRPAQVIRPPGEFDLPLIDLCGMREEQRDIEIARSCAEEAARPFDLSREPLLRARLFRLGEKEHVLFFNVHHIAFDDWSMALLLRECGELYRAYCDGRESPLPELAIQYADFAVWQRNWLQSEVLAERLDYWRRQLDGAPALLALPADRPRPAAQSYRGATESVVFPEPLFSGLKTLAQREGASIFMTLLAAFEVLLHRWTGVEDLVLGTPIAGRNRTETEGLIGFFVNTLALRSDLSGNPSFSGLLRRVREVTLGAYSHQDLPFEKLVEELRPGRDLSHHPIYQVVFALQDIATQTRDAGGLSFDLEWVPSGTSKFDLTVTMIPRAGGIEAMVEYSTDLFERETIVRLLAHFRTLLESVVAMPDGQIAALPLLDRAERDRLLTGWNQTAAEYSRTACIHELFEAQAERTPDAIAVGFGDQSLTYDALNRRANQIAHGLQNAGVGPEVNVGICVEPSLEMVAGLIGILKAGGAYVPLDPAYPGERLAFMIEDSGMRTLLTQQRVLSRLPAHRARVVVLDGDSPAFAGENDRNPASSASAGSRAYVIYTSGSTGRPKGVEVAHRSVVNLVTWHQRTYSVTPADRATQVASLSFDAAVWELWPYLTAGGSVHIADDATRVSPGALVRWIAAQGITVCFLPTPLAEAALAEEWPRDLPLRAILTGGDRLKLNGGGLKPMPCALFNHYGPTENTVVATACRVDPREETPPIGRPIANNEAYVLDRQMQPVPIGVAGKLWIGGESLARGYLNRPELTAEMFVPNPFSTAPGSRIYRTGDLVRYRPDGSIEFLGRIDHQVKIRGFRIEPGEIESALRQHAAVREALVLVREDASGGKRLVAYVAGRRGSLDADGLRAFVKNTLPEYMVPSAFVLLDALPLTANGKIDREALPEPDAAADRAAAESIPPASPLEERLVRMWSEVMGVATVGVTDNFFALGGHSLMAARLISRLRDELHVALPLRSIFEDQTICALALRIAGAQGAEDSKPASGPAAIPRTTRRKQTPLSFAQESLWFLDQLAPDSAAYNVPVSLELDGELDASALRRALGELVQRHQILRTRFETVDGRPVQVVESCAGVEMPLTDLSALPSHDREAEALRLSREEASRPFNLKQIPQIRARLFRLGPARHVLLLNMHHIVSDGWSLGVLVRELGEIYPAFATGGESPLPALPIQYADFAAWQRDWLRGEVLQAQVEYWKKRLHGAPARMELPADHPRPGTPAHRGAVETTLFPPPLVATLKSLGKRNGASLFMVLLAAFETLVHRYTGGDDIVIGSPVAGRHRAETEGLIGFFVNTVVLRDDLSGDPTFEELLLRVKEGTLEAFAHQDLPFEKLVEELNPERHPGCNPLCQILFALQNAPLETTRLGPLGLRLKEVGSGTAKFDLSVSMIEVPGGLEASVEYSADLFDRGTIARLLDHFRTLLEGLAAQPGARISALPLLAEGERRRLLVEWNQTQTDYPRDHSVHQLFEAQAARTPDAVALVFEDQRVTYRELNRRANRLAHDLRRQGVGLESLVGICIDRSVEMIVGLLGILKAGGAYVPLDAAFPAERLALMLEDTQLALILTTERLRRNLPANAASVICMDRDEPHSTPGSDENPASAVTAESLAYVMFTSGSTGRPKGVSIVHRGIVRLVTATDYVKITPRDVFLQFAPVSFDASTFEIWGALLNGARLVIFPSKLASVEELAEFIELQEVSILWLTAALFHEMVDGPVSRLRSVAQLLAGGDVISARHARKFLESNPGSRLINGYGPTENTTFTCCHPLSSAADVRDPVPIGRPIANTRVHVLDRNLQPVPIGVPGELYAGGDGLARGYWNRAELTAEKFVPDSFGIVPGARLYKTGDIVRYLPDGRIEFLGRRDFQVKIRGYRIELGEIEAVLAQHPGVRLVAAVASDAATGGKRIVACVCRQSGSEVSSGELREFLVGRLPDYMSPAEFVFLDKMPLTPTGKLDRAALPLTAGPPAAADSSVAPSDWIEAQLVGLWGSVLGTPPASVRDNFFDLGGHSLLAVRLFAEMEKYLHVRLPVSAIFHAPTVAELAEVVRRNARPGTQPSSGIIPLQSKGTRRPIFFMPSFGQDEAARAGISIFHYRKLAAHLGADQPSHGVATVPDLRDIRSLAAHCAHLIRTVQAHGPYVLAGYCADGEVAYEVARQFEAMGETVELVVVFDGMAPLEKIPIAPGFTDGDWRQKLRWVAGWLSQGPGRAIERIHRRVRRILERRERLQNHLVPCRARLLLFRSEQTLGDYDDPQLGWGSLFGDVRVEIVRGDHFFLLKDPHVGFVAEKLNEHLRKAEPACKGTPAQVPRRG